MNRPSPWRVLLSPAVLIALGLAVRFAFILNMGNRFYFADTAEYEAAALRLMQGLGPGPGAPRAPLFPAVIALGFLLGGKGNFLAVRALQLVLAGTLMATVMSIARRLGGPAAAVLTGVAVAFGPTLVFTTGMLYPTTLYALLLTGAVALVLAWDERPTPWRGARVGILLTLAYLTDPVAIAPGFTLVGWMTYSAGRRGRAGFASLAAMLAAIVIVVAPYVVWQRSAYSGKSVFMQKAQYVLHYSRTDSTLSKSRHVVLPPGTPYEPKGSSAFVKQELGLMRAQPAAYVHDVCYEFVHFFQPMPDRIQTQNKYNRGPVLWLGAIYFTPVLLLFVVGLFSGRRHARGRTLLVLVVLATAAFYSLFFTQTRYRIPVEPLMIVVASLGLLRLVPSLGTALGGEPAGRD